MADLNLPIDLAGVVTHTKSFGGIGFFLLVWANDTGAYLLGSAIGKHKLFERAKQLARELEIPVIALAQLNREHLSQRAGYHDLNARIASYELAAQMQLAAKEAVDFSNESKATQKMYGLEDPATKEYGSRCLIARRLIERDVKYVTLFGMGWDLHFNISTGLPARCKEIDQPSAAKRLIPRAAKVTSLAG